MQDPLVALAASVSTMTFSDGVRNAEEEAETDVDKTESLYAKALYRMRESKGLPQYPDANSTMRITFGNVESKKTTRKISNFGWTTRCSR